MPTLAKIAALALLIASAGAAQAYAQPPAGSMPPADAPYPAQGANAPYPPEAQGAAGPRAPVSPAVRAARLAVRRQCASDLASFCPEARPGPGSPVMQCLRQHRAQLSPGCGQALMSLRAARQAPN